VDSERVLAVTRRDFLALLALFLAIGVGVYRVMMLPLNHDAGWLLYVSERVLNGDRLYVDVIEVNPPLIVWLGIPVILLERLLGVHHTLLFPVLVALGAGSSLAACWRLSGQVLSAPYRAPALAALAAALFVIPSGNWGQREHLMLLLAAPYIFACASRARGQNPGAWLPIGVAAGLGFALKPHFLLMPAALEAWLLISRRPFWRGAAMMAGTIGAYGGAALVFAPEYIPMMLDFREAYSAFATQPLRSLLLHPASLLIAATLPSMFVRCDGQALRTAVGITGGASLVIAVIQSKGFLYHFIPGLAAAMLLTTLFFVAVSTKREVRTIPSIPPLVVALLLVVHVVVLPPTEDVQWEKIAEVRAATTNQQTLILSNAVRDAWPAINYARAGWSMALPSVWPARTEVGAGDHTADLVARGLKMGPVVLVPTQPGRDPLPELLKHEVFRDAWEPYARVDSLTHYRVYRPTEHAVATPGGATSPRGGKHSRDRPFTRRDRAQQTDPQDQQHRRGHDQ
jgi:hypothetical protein